jgi:ribosomal protein S18 acetylase RimI-like enzyme
MPRKDRLSVRRARPSDLPVLGRLGAELARAHHAWDPQRFFVVEQMDEGYAWWLGKELKNQRAVVLVAVLSGKIIGYTYGRIEPRDWNALRDKCGVDIDLIVDSRFRGLGAGKRLTEALLRALQEKGAPRVVLQTAERNRAAQRFFRGMGFRPTMVEMTRELGEPSPRVKRPAPRRTRK